MQLKSYYFLLLLCFLSLSGHAASVSAVKGTKVLISLEGDSAEVGDEFFLLNPETRKKTAVIRITQVKKGKALAKILKGRANSGYDLEAKGPSRMSADTGGAPSPAAQYYQGQMRDSWGILGGYLMNSMQADISYRDSFGASQKTSVSMNGSGFGVGGFYNYLLTPEIVAQPYVALEQFNVTGSASAAACASSTNCYANITYLSLYGLFKWYPSQDKYRFWLAGGGGFLLALSKSATALNEAEISTNQVFTLGIGVDILKSQKNYIPISLEYNLFPASATVKASSISLKAGWAWNL